MTAFLDLCVGARPFWAGLSSQMCVGVIGEVNVKGKVFASVVLAACLVSVLAGAAAAQDVIMNSAETINKGNFKLAVFPTVVFNENGTDSQGGVHGRLGYGITDRLDIEAKFARFDNLKFYGGDVELWIIGHPQATNVSVAVGANRSKYDNGGGLTGIDGTLLLSFPISKRAEFYAGLLAARQSVQDYDRKFNTYHIVPGVEIRITRYLDLLGEIGLGVTSDSLDYGSIGLAFYLR